MNPLLLFSHSERKPEYVGLGSCQSSLLEGEVPYGTQLMGRAQMEKGIEIFKDLGKIQMTIFFTTSEECYSKHQKLPKYQTDLQMAYNQSPKNWRYAFSLAEDHFKSGNTSVALKIIQKTINRTG